MTGMPPQIPPGVMQGMQPSPPMNTPPTGTPQVPPGAMGVGGPPPGVDPRNSMMGQPQMTPIPPPTDDDEAGSVPATTDPGHAQIIRSMHNAYKNKGVNPYNSHPEMSKKWERAWKDKANRDALKAAKMEEMKAAMKIISKMQGKGTNGSPSPAPSSPIRR